MFPSVKTPKDESAIKGKLRERQWDQKFASKGSIPQYSPLKDKHTKSYRKSIISSVSKLQKNGSQLHTQRAEKTKATYFEKKVNLFDKLKKAHPVYLSHLEEYEEFLAQSKLPSFYVYFSSLPLLTEIDVNGYITKMKKGVRQNSSPYHRITTAIKAREKCLEQLKHLVSKVKESEVEMKKQFLHVGINNLRSLTANVIDQIKRWREALHLGQEQKAVFHFTQDQNYLITILNDNSFVFRSELASFINFGEKNDPFLIIPLKKAEGKQASEFLEILETEKNLAYYQKYMEYLASQRAYELSLNEPSPVKRGSKPNQIQKVYRSKSSFPRSDAYSSTKTLKPAFQEGQQLEYQKMERARQRQQRLKKNQERINAIKSVYQTYHTKANKLSGRKQKKESKAQTDIEGRFGEQPNRSKSKKKISLIHQTEFTEFQNMVRLKYKKRQADRKTSKERGQYNSKMKTLNNEDKMVQNLRDIQTTLKSKLAYVKQDSKKEQISPKKAMRSTGEILSKKTNQDLINELKNQIILNLEKENNQREASRYKKRQEEERAMEQIRMKMKKQMQQKLEAKKRQKLIQREQLEKKLKEEQERLQKHREIQLQLQLKLAKEKDLKELQKLKRKSLQREKSYKQQLSKEKNLRKQRQNSIQSERKQKQRILQQLKKRELKDQLQSQIRDEMKQKYGEGSRLLQAGDGSRLISQKQQQLAKQIELLKIKQQSQIDQISRENQLRQRMLKLKRDQEQLKRNEIQHLMKSVVQGQKEDLHREALKKRIELEQEIKNNSKQKLLQQYRAQKQAVIESNKLQRQRQLEEEVYRQKIRQKIEKEMRMEALQRTKKEMEDKEMRRYQMGAKMETVRSNFQNNLEQDIDKDKIQNQVKKDLIEKVLFDKQAQRQSAKNDLRTQFQRQLMASSIPNIYKSNDSEPILRKNIDSYKQDEYLRQKLTTLQQSQKPTNQKSQENDINIAQSKRYQKNDQNPKEQQPMMKSRLSKNISNATSQQLYIYSKKKNKVNQMKDSTPLRRSKGNKDEQGGFQLLNVQEGAREYNFEPNKRRKQQSSRENSKPSEFQPSNKREQQVDDEDQEEQRPKPKKASKKKSQKIKRKYQSEGDSENEPKIIMSAVPKQKKQSDQAPSSDEQRNKRKKSEKDPSSRMGKRASKPPILIHFGKSRNSQRQTPNRLQTKQSQEYNPKLRQSKLSMNQDSKVHYDAQRSNVPNNFMEESKIQIRQIKHSADSKYQIRLQAIPQEELDQYLATHFQQISQVQRSVQLHNREELYRKLINELTFCMLLGYQGNIIVGIAFAYHDRNKTDSRKFVIVHVSTYQDQHLKEFIVSSVNYIFRKDPADQIEFHYKFDEAIEQQYNFSVNFNKWFDRYGNVYQKKIKDDVYERKYALKRQFNQKCEVVLGGVNKNSFRNLFTVYSGLVMSETDLIQIKEELREVMVPQNQISYAISVAEMFRTFLTPDQADVLKSKVKQFAKLKELLILVVMLQKKKFKMDEIKLSEYKNLVELNMKLMSQGKDVIRYCKDIGSGMNRIFYAQLSQAFNLPFNFQTTSLPVQSEQDSKIRHVSYFRLSPLNQNKLHIIKTTLYNSEMHFLPTENSKYKLFVINAQQYNEIKQDNHLDIFMYVRLFLKNVKSHNTASWKYVWLPEMADKANFSVRQFRSFLDKDIYCHDSINISYKQFLPNALIIEPKHTDLVITPPFIVGVMSMSLEQITQGSPIYARMIDVPALRTLEIEDQ